VKAYELLAQPLTESSSGKAQLTWKAGVSICGRTFAGARRKAGGCGVPPPPSQSSSRLFTRFSKRSFNQYLMEVRLARSRELLKSSSSNINEIAYACGFSDPNYFIRCHRKFFGKPPGQARVDLR